MKTPAALELRSEQQRDELIEKYLPLVRHVAARLPVTMPATLDRDDLFSAGTIGLIHAASNYNPDRGASFKTFAYTTIRGAILDEIRKHDPLPRGRRDRLRAMNRASIELRAELERAPTIEELAARLDVSATDLDEDLLALHTHRTLSLEHPVKAEGEEFDLGQTLADESNRDPGDAVARQELVEQLAGAIGELPETERHAMILYHYEDMYLKEIGELLGVTESRVSQILSKATSRLRLKMKAQV
ncbi:MAG: FliA/WhiG family RNA polymerase sigma factor [Planctomycetota bacterium]|jgi:RNA polymerase sigma factor for flagellar operon FliA|nr:FliA/WhiG family RNA polymerase sigma factor [Planctomycetota bacterium]